MSRSLPLLVGYGAGAINPYLAFDTIGETRRGRNLRWRWTSTRDAALVRNYLKAT